MLARPKKKELSAEQRMAITQASSHQTGSMVSPKTYDPNYPLFDIPVNGKVLIYIPNHQVQDADGSMSLRRDKFASHQAIIGKAYQQIRCTGEIVNEELGYDGSCPACNAMAEAWKLYSYQWKAFCAAKGLDPESDEVKETYKNDRKELMNKMAIQRPVIYYTFPIVVIECEEGKTIPKKDANGGLIGHPMFYTVAESTYTDKWLTAFDAVDEGGEDQNPGGRWAILNYTYTPKSGQHNKRDSARNLKVSFKTMDSAYDAWAKQFDDMTKDWTPEKAQDVLVQNSIRDMDEMNEAVAEIMKTTREQIATYESASQISGVAGIPQMPGQVATSAEQTLENFGATPQAPLEGEAPSTPVAPPVMGEMPSGNIGVQ